MPNENEEIVEETKVDNDSAETELPDVPVSDLAVESASTPEPDTGSVPNNTTTAKEESTVSVDYDAEIDGPVTVKPIKFASFEDLSQTQGEINKNLEILMDIKLQMTVELGRTELPIKKVLELTRGSIIELEKVAGEPVELYANGKLVAHGEVVVIEDNFGLRITSITEPEDRLKGIT